MFSFRNPDCYCCGKIRNNPRARWSQCLKFNKPSCPPMNVPSNNVLAPSNAQQSKIMRNAQYLKVNSNNVRWRKVNWRRFKIQQQTKQYQTRVITNSTNNPSKVVVRNGKIPVPTYNLKQEDIVPNCRNALDLKWTDIISMDEQQLKEFDGGIPITCDKYVPPGVSPLDIEKRETIQKPQEQYCQKIQEWEKR